jgi:hypothetical protein
MTRWTVTGVFLLYSLLIVAATEVLMPAALLYPAAYWFYARRETFPRSAILTCLPLGLAFFPAYAAGAVLYGVLLVVALSMRLFIGRGSPALAVAVPATLIFVLVMAGIFSAAQEQGVAVTTVVSGWADTVMSESTRASAGVFSGKELSDFQDMLSLVRDRMVKLFPALVLTGATFMLWLNLLVIAVKGRAANLGEWRSPEVMIGLFIIAGLLTIVPMQGISTVGLNLLIVVGQVYFFQGIAIVSVFMAERGWPLLIRWPLYILIVIQIYMMVIVAGLGLFDAWFDFRKWIRTPKGDIR